MAHALELGDLLVATPGAIVALHQLRAICRVARAARPRVTKIDISIHISVRRR